MAFFGGDATSAADDGGMHHALRRRLTELWGSGFLALGLLVAAALISYDPGDPSHFRATGEAPRNWLGRPGAILADPMMRFLGLGAWVAVAFLLAWGLRLVRHRGEERIWVSVLILPVAVVLGTVFAATHPISASWPLPVGLGGILGDNGARAILAASSLPDLQTIKLASLGLALAGLLIWGVAFGVTIGEVRVFAIWIGGSVMRLIAAARRTGADPARRAPDAEPAETGERPAPALAAPKLDPAELSAPELRSGPGTEDPPARPHRHADGLSRILSRLNLRTADRPDEPDLEAPEPPASAPSPPDDAGRREPVLDKPLPKPPGDDDRSLAAAFRAIHKGEVPPRLGDGQIGVDQTAAMMALADESSPAAKLAVSHPTAKPDRKSRQAEREAQPMLALDGLETGGDYDAPPLGLLQRKGPVVQQQVPELALEENARMLETVLEDYGVKGEITAVKPGPVVTLYELEPAPGLKASRVIGLADDIARSMSALAARVATVPGRSVIGIELPNTQRDRVLLREVLESPDYGDNRFPLALALGKDIEGRPVVTNLAKMPHLLIAGTTGSGKSVSINTMILSLLYRLSPERARVIMIDPKMLELSVYDGIPHLLAPVVTDPKKAVVALKWVVAEMEERYRKMSKMGVRSIDGYNARIKAALDKGEAFERRVQTGFDEASGEPVYETESFAPEPMPFIVVIVDEMADLMMVAGKEIEACIQRLAQMARASGIHLIMATQRPSVDVITGTIKANFPTRISFQVTSKIDSRTILGEQGAEQLLGQGDMLFMEGGGRIKRVHAPFVSDEEVEEVVRHLKALGPPAYVEDVTDGGEDEMQTGVEEKLGLGAPGDSDEVLYDKAVAIVARDRKCSTSYIQRKLAVGYNKAARLVEMMEDQGVVSPANAVGKREILVADR